jgi:hypothetical protein
MEHEKVEEEEKGRGRHYGHAKSPDASLPPSRVCVFVCEKLSRGFRFFFRRVLRQYFTTHSYTIHPLRVRNGSFKTRHLVAGYDLWLDSFFLLRLLKFFEGVFHRLQRIKTPRKKKQEKKNLQSKIRAPPLRLPFSHRSSNHQEYVCVIFSLPKIKRKPKSFLRKKKRVHVWGAIGVVSLISFFRVQSNHLYAIKERVTHMVIYY